MKAVDVLGWVHRIENSLGVDLWRQWHLHQNAVYVVARVQFGDERQQFFGADRCGGRDEEAGQAKLPAGAGLAVYVKFRSGVVANQHRRASGTNALRRERL